MTSTCHVGTSVPTGLCSSSLWSGRGAALALGQSPRLYSRTQGCSFVNGPCALPSGGSGRAWRCPGTLPGSGGLAGGLWAVGSVECSASSGEALYGCRAWVPPCGTGCASWARGVVPGGSSTPAKGGLSGLGLTSQNLSLLVSVWTLIRQKAGAPRRMMFDGHGRKTRPVCLLKPGRGP